ncbi:MAG: aminotransferase class III-fold pyridoxal phosphate-dependent enzyme [Chloroflexota bacterium]|nr:aminotransferase class III-fold pyridoxal phosphate-dependent enzyme [Chloroflexota bacterium]
MARDVNARSAGHARLLETGERVMPGGALGMFRLPDVVQLVVREGRGSKVYDVDGREYVDYILGSGPMLIGHAHPTVVEAVSRQVARGSTFYLPTESTIRLAERICTAAPCAEQVRFVSSGSEATKYALRLARAYTGRDKVLKFEGGYHGGGDYAQYSTAPHGEPDFPRAHPETAGIPKVLDDQVLVAPFNDLETTGRLVAEHAGELGAVIVEPLQRCVPPAPGFLPGVRQLTREHGIPLVLDEVVTGFRLARGGAQEYYAVECDLAAYGKAVSGGYALAAVAGRADIMRLCDPRNASLPNYVMITGTLSGNPIAATAGLATLDVLEQPGVYERLHQLGNRLRQGLVDVGQRVGLPLQAPGEGPVFQPLISEHAVTDARTLAKQDAKATQAFGVELIREGVLTNPGGKMYVSTAHDEADVDRTLDAAERALRRIKDGR